MSDSAVHGITFTYSYYVGFKKDCLDHWVSPIVLVQSI